MSTYLEPVREIPVYGHYDVVVCGGGSAGFIAAIAAARGGAKTLIIERYGFFGGTATAAMMVEFGSMHDGKRPLVGGITHEFLHRMEAYGGVTPRGIPESHMMVFDPESMIQVCQEMVQEAGVDILLHSWIADAVREGDRVVGVIVENKSGRQMVHCTVAIDCTGDGDLSARAHVPFDIGRPGDGMMQPISIELILSNIDDTKTGSNWHKRLIPKIAEARQRGTWTIPTDQLFSWGKVTRRGQPSDEQRASYFINGTNCVGCDGTNARSLSDAELKARRQINQMVEFLRSNAPGFEHCFVDRVAAQIGVRETRRMRGGYTLTRDDVLNARHFADGVVPGCNSIDVHDVHGKTFSHEWLRPNTHYQIPYRCFLPPRVDGLLFAGRCLSADHWALGSVRVMIVTMPMGEAVGTAASLAIKQVKSVHEINVEELRSIIRERGTVLE